MQAVPLILKRDTLDIRKDMFLQPNHIFGVCCLQRCGAKALAKAEKQKGMNEVNGFGSLKPPSLRDE